MGKMQSTRSNDQVYGEGYVLAHPTRLRIVNLLKKTERSYASEIAKKLGIDEKLVGFHLAALSQYGFVDSEFELMNPPKGAPKAVRYYWLTPKAEEVLSQFKKLL